MNHPTRALAASLAPGALAALLLAGCAAQPLGAPSGQGRAASGPAGRDAPLGGARTRGASAPAEPAAAVDDVDVKLAELDRRLAQWDAAQAEGRIAQADALAPQIVALVDGSFDSVLGAARGERGQAGTYVGTMGLAFSRRPEATATLAERLGDRDTRLVANALIALKLRADPDTPLAPVVGHLASAQADVRRFAPLALARVLEARRRLGRAPEAELKGQALRRLAATVKDQDPHVRLHTVRALGELSTPEAQGVLLPVLEDSSSRVALGAASALARHGSRAGFERVIHLLHNSSAEAQPLVAGTLVVYAERLTGAPLADAEVQRLGASAPAWARWYADFVKR